jgi:hypothetical protein
MIRIKKGISCKTIGELKKAIANIPDDTKFVTTGDEDKYLVEIWKLQKDSELLMYEDEKSNAEYEGRKPNFRRVSISEDEF